MTDGFSVDVDQIRAHAARIEALRQRFGAVRSASAAISRDDAAYGLLCGWMAGILEARHVRQDQLIAYVEENVRLAAESLLQVSAGYTATDDAAARRLRQAGGLE
jgi:hypothetical protein